MASCCALKYLYAGREASMRQPMAPHSRSCSQKPSLGSACALTARTAATCSRRRRRRHSRWVHAKGV
jgi:hypothetical protein